MSDPLHHLLNVADDMARLITECEAAVAANATLMVRIATLEAQVAAADRLADEADAAAGTLDCLGMHRPILELKIAAYRAAKGE